MGALADVISLLALTCSFGVAGVVGSRKARPRRGSSDRFEAALRDLHVSLACAPPDTLESHLRDGFARIGAIFERDLLSLWRNTADASCLRIAGGVAAAMIARPDASRASRDAQSFYTMSDAAPVVMRLTGPAGCTFVNRAWLAFTGRSIEQEIGSGWQESVHPADLNRVVDAYHLAIAAKEPFGIEYRLRRHDDTYRWVADSGAPWLARDGVPAEYINTLIDISDKKMAEQALRELSGRLIAAQEDERRRIARELHDDVSQRLALMSIEIEDLGQHRSPEAAQRWRALSRATSDIATDLHGISHRLHPSKLETLGLGAALNGFCQQLWRRQHLQVRLRYDGLSATIPGDVSLCIYRIVQEALQNVIKHSGVMEAEVNLLGSRDSLLLRIADAGRGFSPEPGRRSGLGLLSMRERVYSLGGDIIVQTAPGHGTRIGVRVALASATDEKRSA